MPNEKNWYGRQLLQKLSATLWHYNGKMVLCQHALTLDNDLEDFG